MAVYNLDSGNTHLLNPTAGAVLRAIAQNPAPVSTLAEQIAAENFLEADAELHYNIERLLVYLDSLGLIEPLTQ